MIEGLQAASEIIGLLQRLNGKEIRCLGPLGQPVVITVSIDDDIKADVDHMCQLIQRGIEEGWLWVSS